MDVDDEELLELLFCCDKFQFAHGKFLCLELLRENLTADNALGMYDKSPQLLEEEKYILDFLDDHADEIIHQDTFLTVSEKTVIDIVQRDRLQIDEVELFNCVIRWGERQCSNKNIPKDENLKRILHSIIPHVRFPLMPIDQFAEITSRCQGLLSPEQQLPVFQYLGAEPEERDQYLTPFVSTPRVQSIKSSLFWERAHNLFTISSDKKSVTYNGGSNRTHVSAASRCKLISGRYRIRMEHRGGWTYYVGICTAKHPLDVPLGSNGESWALTYAGQLLHNQVERSGYGANLANSVIEIVVDLSKNTLSFRTQNSPSTTTAFTDHGLAYMLPSKERSFYLAVSMDYDTTATIVGFNKNVTGTGWT